MQELADSLLFLVGGRGGKIRNDSVWRLGGCRGRGWLPHPG